MKTQKMLDNYTYLVNNFFDITGLAYYHDVKFKYNEELSNNGELFCNIEIKKWGGNTTAELLVKITESGIPYLKTANDRWEMYSRKHDEDRILWKTILNDLFQKADKLKNELNTKGIQLDDKVNNDEMHEAQEENTEL